MSSSGVILEGAAEATAVSIPSESKHYMLTLVQILLLNCIITFVLHPEPVKRAQAELDEYLSGRDRSPRLEDIDHLPYCKAVVFEVCDMSMHIGMLMCCR